MSWDQFAPNYTRVITGQTNVAIGTGGSVKVYNISATAGSTAATITLEEFGTTNIMFVIILEIDTSVTFAGNGFIADKGLQVTVTGTGAECTVYHGNIGS